MYSHYRHFILFSPFSKGKRYPYSSDPTCQIMFLVSFCRWDCLNVAGILWLNIVMYSMFHYFLYFYWLYNLSIGHFLIYFTFLILNSSLVSNCYSNNVVVNNPHRFCLLLEYFFCIGFFLNLFSNRMFS